MDAFAAFGSLIVTEGATAPMLVQPPLAETVQDVRPDIAQRPEDVQAVDTVFATADPNSEQHPVMALLVTTASMSAIKGIVLDEGARQERGEDEEEEPPKNKADEAN